MMFKRSLCRMVDQCRGSQRIEGTDNEIQKQAYERHEL